MCIQVIIAEPDPLIGEGLAKSLCDEPRLFACHSTESPDLLLERCRQMDGGVLLMAETYLETMDLARLAREADFGRGVPVLVLGGRANGVQAMRVLRLGCMGYVHRQETLATLQKAIQAAAAGQLWAPRTTLTEVLRQLADGRERVLRLTPRESEVLALVGEGCSNAQIAERLYISGETVRWHVRRVFVKIGAADRSSAVEFVRQRLVPPCPARALPGPLPVRSERWAADGRVEIAHRA